MNTMKKFFSIFVAVLISVAMWGEQTYFYSGEGNGKNWSKTEMEVSSDGFYEYYRISSTTTHKFKIGTSSDQWAYNYTYVTAGFNSTDVTEIGDYGSDNCYCWKGSTHYILVYYPNTTINTTNKPIICASTILPDDTPAPTPIEKDSIYFVNINDWENPTVHLWGGTAAGTTWPGVALTTKINDKAHGHDIYKYVADKGAYTNCIFSNNGANKTENLNWTSEQYCSEGVWYANIAAIPEPAVPAKFYVTGDSALVVDAGLEANKAWNTYAIKSEKDTLVLENLKAGQDYQLKVTVDGTWETQKKYTDLTEVADGLQDLDGDNHTIGFKISKTGDVKVIYTSTLFKLIGDFCVDSTTLYFVNTPDWATVKAYAFLGETPYKAWPGDDMKPTGAKVNGYDIYSYTFPSSYNKIIFNKGEGGANNQTANLTWDAAAPYFYPTTKDSESKYDAQWYANIAAIPGKYYVSGDSALVVDGGLTADKKWNADAFKATQDTFTLNLKANQEYYLKVTLDGTWDNPTTNTKGYDELTEKATGLLRGSGDNENNICFKLNKAGEVKIVYTSSLFKLIGDFYVKPIENKMVRLVPSEEWLDANAKFAAWTWGAEQEGKWSSFFTPISEDNDTLQAIIKTSADSIDFVRFSPKTIEPTWDSQGELVVVWNQLKDTIDWKGLTASIDGWNTLSWKAVERSPESYGLLINDVYHAGKRNVVQSWREYMVLNVELHAGDQLQVRDDYRDANWVISTYMGNSYYIPIINDKYVVENDGIYDFYLKLVDGANEIYISKAGFATKAVPDQCEDVLMQAFYNESYNGYAAGVSTIGDTRWNSLAAEAEDIRSYFDLVWLPPSAYGDGMGYHPKNYGNQSSNWGTSSELDNLIKTLHGPDPNKIQARVVADIVINHCQSSSGWMGFPEFDFGTYGKYKPVGEWICANDEVNWADGSDAKGQAKGPDDDGENWSGARDWSHSNVDVQNMFKAYLKWMRDVVGYDGFRYDKGDGFNNWHHDNYNKAAGPYIAFMECYSNTDEIWWRIEKANHNLMALDFDTKWHVFDAIAGFRYPGRGGGLLGRNLGHYAIEFIDSHDWFLRSDNSNEFGGHGNSLKPELKDRLLQANAFLLSMPGVPCVFYPHWKTYPNEIKAMIEARKWAGVHSDSPVSNESVSDNSDGYQATIEGKYGYLILQLGNKTTHSKEGIDWLSPYELKASGPGYAMWVNRTTPLPAAEYYLVGSKYNWATANERLFIGSGKEGEYVIKGVTFEENELIKVVKVVNNKFKAWYPAENYVISSEEAGVKDIYFRPEAYDAWGKQNIHIVTPSTPTFIDNINNQPTIKAEKFMKDGQLFIRMGEKTFDLMGKQIK